MKKRILFFSRDPGSVNVIFPLIPAFQQEYEVLLFGKDAALKRFELFSVEAQDISNHIPPIISVSYEKNSTSYYLDFLKKLNPDALITGTGSDDYSEKYLWRAAKVLGIPSFAILDGWQNTGVRFSKWRLLDIDQYVEKPDLSFLPSKIFCVDEISQKQLLDIGMDEKNIVVSGQPYFEYLETLSQTIDQKSVEEFRETIDSDDHTLLFSYISENITEVEKGQDLEKYYFGYTERSIFEDLMVSLSSFSANIHKKMVLIVRKHPNEKMDVYSDVIEKYQTEDLEILVDPGFNPFLLMKASDLIIGMSSMFLIEALFFNKPILSVQIGLKCPDPFILSSIGYIQSIKRREDLRVFFDTFFHQKALKVKIPFKVSGAIQTIKKTVEEFL